MRLQQLHEQRGFTLQTLAKDFFRYMDSVGWLLGIGFRFWGLGLGFKVQGLGL